MHALMSAVLLRRGWMDEARLHAKLEPPCRQPRQAACSARTERRAVVAADRKRQAIGAKCRCKDRPRSLNRRRHDPHIDQKTTMTVRYRQRIDSAAIAGSEPAFEVGSPLVIGCRHRRNGSLLVNCPPPSLDRLNQLGPFENVADRRRHRPVGFGGLSLEYRQQFTRPQMREPASQRDNCIRQLLGRSGADNAMERASDPKTNPARRSRAAFAIRKTYRDKPRIGGTNQIRSSSSCRNPTASEYALPFDKSR